jgi:hypothetical protein
MACAVSAEFVRGRWAEEDFRRCEVGVGAVVLGPDGVLGEVELVLRGVAVVRLFPGMGRPGGPAVAAVPCDEVTVVVRPGDILDDGERGALLAA